MNFIEWDGVLIMGEHLIRNNIFKFGVRRILHALSPNCCCLYRANFYSLAFSTTLFLSHISPSLFYLSHPLSTSLFFFIFIYIILKYIYTHYQGSYNAHCVHLCMVSFGISFSASPRHCLSLMFCTFLKQLFLQRY